MFDAGTPLPAIITDAGLWLGLLITLLIFSLLAGDNALARVAQHLLVGASAGYATLLAIQYVISTRLLAPLARGEWLPNLPLLLLVLVFVVAGMERIFAQGRSAAAAGNPRTEANPQISGGRWLLHSLGAIPLAIILGVGIAASVAGIVQGTIYRQIGQVVLNTWAQNTTGNTTGNSSALWTGILTLFLTTATLLHMSVNRHSQIDPLPRPLRDLLQVWVWFGERALWIATGIILARLFASRLTLLVDRINYVAATLQATGLWQWFAAIWQNLVT